MCSSDLIGAAVVTTVGADVGAFVGADFRQRANFTQDTFDNASYDSRAGVSYGESTNQLRITGQSGRYTLDNDLSRRSEGMSGDWKYTVNPSNQFNVFSVGDPNRKALDQIWTSGYLKMLPSPNDYSVGDGLNTAGYRWYRRQYGQDGATGLGCQGPVQVTGQGVESPTRVISIRDQRGCSGHRQPGLGEQRPLLRRGSGQPDVIGGGGAPGLVDLPVRGQEPVLHRSTALGSRDPEGNARARERRSRDCISAVEAYPCLIAHCSSVSRRNGSLTLHQAPQVCSEYSSTLRHASSNEAGG